MRGFSLILRFGQAESQVAESSFVGVRRALQVRGHLEEVHNVREGRGMLEKWLVGVSAWWMAVGWGAGWVCWESIAVKVSGAGSRGHRATHWPGP